LAEAIEWRSNSSNAKTLSVSAASRMQRTAPEYHRL
jgi:hypothetical protein